MKYILEDSHKNIEENLTDWVRRFLRYKLTTLSNRLVANKEEMFEILEKMQEEKNIDEITKICRKARNIGLIGINTYFTPLVKFCHFIQKKQPKSLKDIDEEMLNDFLAIYTSSLSPQTKKSYRIALIGLFKYIDKQNEITPSYSHVFGIELKNAIKNSKAKLPSYLKKEEIEIFLKALKDFPCKTNVQKRDRAILNLILHTGIRISEALYLELRHIILEDQHYILNIRGKGDKSRVLIIKQEILKSDLEEWLHFRNTIPKIVNNLLFCNKKGNPITQGYFYKIVEKILKYAGIKKEKMGPHLLRHSFATLLYQQYKDLILVQETLGHADMNTSRIYTHFDKDRLTKMTQVFDDFKKK
ncbi:tyrosine-type recombinase/integrase [Helicobacter anatolicus]|uniref:tyrosine-type recombinase/integrase n=1 Tax=Helicobacter anatolicus TaxID=2905874 RepID=UPI001E6062B6|nr:tyrosine-type recombinase/integrase [Helicobacter anatolicus]MCE3039054.1 tyrosine-type recombinase/integrase [Helicobacter anatolicus]